jgi:hypothetical protein
MSNVAMPNKKDDDLPITTREYLLLGTIESKKRRKLELWLWISLALICIAETVITIGGLIYVQRVISREVALDAAFHAFQANATARQAINTASAVAQKAEVVSRATLSELKNQKTIASLRATKNNAVDKNEVQLCQVVYMLIERQKKIANIITSDPIFSEHKNDPEFIRRQASARALDKEINNSKLPKCDGFPSAQLK